MTSLKKIWVKVDKYILNHCSNTQMRIYSICQIVRTDNCEHLLSNDYMPGRVPLVVADCNGSGMVTAKGTGRAAL